MTRSWIVLITKSGLRHQGRVVQSWIKITQGCRVGGKFEVQIWKLKKELFIVFLSICSVDALHRIILEKIIRKNLFGQEKKKPRLKFNPGQALIVLGTTGSRSTRQFRLRVISHFSSGIVERAKCEQAWKSPHARKGRKDVCLNFVTFTCETLR